MLIETEQSRKNVLQQRILDMPLTALSGEFTIRTSNVLRIYSQKTVREFLENTEKELLAYKNFGVVCLNEVKEVLNDFGLHLGMTDNDGAFIELKILINKERK